MLRKIKSNFILKKVFIHLVIKKRLKVISYNKNIQKKLGLELVDFIRYSGKRKEEKNGKIFEYDNFHLNSLFEGVYLNGKRNGEGTEYNDNREIIFEGDYLQDKRWKGFEREYDEDTGKLIFKYELKNGKKEGKVEEYNKYTGDIIFSGHYLNGKRNGNGIEYKIPNEKGKYHYYSSRDDELKKIFEGEYINGQRKKGKEYNYEGNLIYEGEYQNNKKNGKGKFYHDCDSKKIKYEGEILNGKEHGKGIEYDIYEQQTYEGEFLNGKKNGNIKEYSYFEYKDKNETYKGSYLLFEGEYFNDYKIRGKEYYRNGKIKYEGDYLFNKKWKGKIYDYNGNIIYEYYKGKGNNIIKEDDYKIIIFYCNNLDKEKYNSIIIGKEYDFNGRLLFEGEYLKEKKWKGKINQYYKDELVFEGDYINGKIWSGKGKEYKYLQNLFH